MSMWVNLVKVSPSLLQQITTKPALLEAMLFDEGDPGIDGFDQNADVYGEDYRHMFVPYFQYIAEQAGEEDPEDFEGCDAVMKDPMYRGISGEQEIDYDFCYGPAMYNDIDTVRGIVADWADSFSDEDLADAERPDVAMFLFYKDAAAKGHAIICGIS